MWVIIMAEGRSVKENTSFRGSDSTERISTCNVSTNVFSEKSVKREEHVFDCRKALLHDGKYATLSPTHVPQNAAAGRNWPSRGARASARAVSVSLINISESPQLYTVERNSHVLSTSLPNGLDLRMPLHSSWVPEGLPNAGTREHSYLSSQRLSDPDPQRLSQLSAQDHSNSHTEEQSVLASSSFGDTFETAGSSSSPSGMQPHSHDGHASPQNPSESTPHDQRPQEEEVRRLSISSLFISQFANKRNRTPSICVHRVSLPREGPPCYSCSTFDLPPKYHKVDEPGWKWARSRFLRMYRGLVSFGQPGQQADLPLRPEGDWNTPPYTIALGSHQEPSLCTTNSSSDDGPCAECPSGSPQSSSAVASSALPTQIHRPPMSDVPPPYSPPTPASLMAGQSLPQLTEDQFFAMRRPTPVEMDQVTFNFHQGYCNKSCHCNFVYSLLLAIITSVSLLGPEQPLIILISAVFFLTVFLYMPIIWALECLLHWRTHGNCRDMRMTGLGTVSPVSVL